MLFRLRLERTQHFTGNTGIRETIHRLGSSGADLEIAGGGGCWVQTIGRAAAAGRPEARSAGGRPWGWVREGVALDPLP